MASHRIARDRGKRSRFAPRLEVMEERSLMASAVPGVTLDPLTVPKFVNELKPNTLALGNTDFVYQPTGTTTVKLADGTTATDVPLYQVGAFQTTQNLLGTKDTNGNPLPDTTVYGYGPTAGGSADATYPGRSFVVKKNEPIAVQWTNGLPGTTHLLPVDPTVLDPADKDSLYTVTPDPTTGAQNVTFPSGVPIVTHVHGGHTQAIYDGTPLQWFTPTTTPTTGVHGTDFPGQTTSGTDFPDGPGQSTFTYDNSQQAGTIWYHDHAMGVTRLNVYAGLAGFYIIHDQNELGLTTQPAQPGVPTPPPSKPLPAEQFDIPLAIQDRMFYAADDPATPQVEVPGQLYYPANVLKGTTASYPSVHPEFFGDTILVDGKAWPVMNVEPRMYRFRVLDGSQSRFYNLRFDVQQGPSQPFFQIGTDDGLLAAPVSLNQLLIAPGERADIVVDFSKLAGKTIIMTNTAKGPFPHGAPGFPDTTGQIMAFKVGASKIDRTSDATLTATTPLNTIAPPDITPGMPVRSLGLFEGVDSYGRLIQKLGSLPIGSDPVQSPTNPNPTPIAPSDFVGPNARPTEVPLGATEVWKFYNVTADTHPIHLHSTSFQIVSRQKFNWKVDPATGGFVVTALTGQPTGPDANENGWKDTARMNPGEVTTILVKFDLPGKYVWHCHILEHEEHDMMNQLIVGATMTTAAPPPPSSTLVNATSQPVLLTTGSTSNQVVTPTVVDPSINPTSVPLDWTLRKKLFGY